MLKILENSFFTECKHFKDHVSVSAFSELLDKMEAKE
jgi:hypothetical protein